MFGFKSRSSEYLKQLNKYTEQLDAAKREVDLSNAEAMGVLLGYRDNPLFRNSDIAQRIIRRHEAARREYERLSDRRPKRQQSLDLSLDRLARRLRATAATGACILALVFGVVVPTALRTHPEWFMLDLCPVAEHSFPSLDTGPVDSAP